MNSFSYYLTETLGVKNYLCPKEIHSFRKLSGSLPCNMLVVTEGTLNTEALQLLKKIMKAIGVSDFSLMELQDLSSVSNIKHFLLSKKPARKVLIFSTKLSSLFTDSNTIFTSDNLEDLLTGPAAKNKKLKLWNQLKQWEH